MTTKQAVPTELPPSVAILQMLAGKWVSQALSTVARLSIAEHLKGGAKRPEQLAELTSTHPQSIHRVLRALASVGVFAENESGTFANTPLSEALLEDGPASMKSMAIFFGNHPTWDAWGEFEYSVRTGKSCFEHVHKAGYFDYMRDHPEEGRYFDEAMTGFSKQENEAIHRAFDFSSVETLVDIAGGHGALLISSLVKNPKQRGILFEQPQVAVDAKRAIAASELQGRCEIIGGDFFSAVPSGADGYMMKHILHDWDDAHATRILESVQKATKPGARLFVIESIIQPGNEPAFAKLMDLEMLVLYKGGRERTAAEFESLFSSTGFELVRVVPTPSTASVIEARRI